MMNKLNFFPTIIAASMFLFATSCSVDKSTESDNAAIDQFESLDSKSKTSTELVQIVVEWHKDVDEASKQKLRNDYKSQGVLNKYKKCIKDEYELWEINCDIGTCNRTTDTPVDTDDDVKRLHFNVTCKDF